MSTPLFPHQRLALAWMVGHENICTGGMREGILADDMGLGKSLTVISLVLTNFWYGMPLLKPKIGFCKATTNHKDEKGEKSSKEEDVGQCRGSGCWN